MKELGVIGKSKMIIDDTPGISISELRSKCRKFKLEQGLDLIIIDYLQLMTGRVGGRAESRQQEISDISRSLKGLARELNCTGYCTFSAEPCRRAEAGSSSDDVRPSRIWCNRAGCRRGDVYLP